MTYHRPASAVGFALLCCACVSGAAELFPDPLPGSVPGVPVPPPWEVRVARKASDPGSRPRWAWTAEDDGGGGYLAVNQVGPAAGTFYLGRRVRIPDPVPPLEFRLTYRTSCPVSNRSGGLEFLLLDPEVWGAMSADPETDTVPPEGILFKHPLHANREDTPDWTRVFIDEDVLRTPLTALAGREVIAAVSWNTWHPDEAERASFREMRLGAPGPRLDIVVPSGSVPAGVDVTVRVRARAPGGFALRLMHGAGVPRSVVDPVPVGDDLFEAVISPGDAAGFLGLTAELTPDDGGPTMTADRSVKILVPPRHPCVFYTPAMLRRMREKIDTFDWARVTYEKIKANADARLARLEEPPLGPGGWSHDYVCADDGARLSFREDSPTRHRCPSCGKEWEGEKLDNYWRCITHGRFAGAAGDLALTAQLSGEEKYALAAGRILLWYAENYARFPEGRGPAGRGRVHSQSLSECTWLLSMMEAADLAYPFLTPDERARIDSGLFAAGIAQVTPYRFGIHNIQCWHNACIGVGGYFLGDEELIAKAVDGPLGFREQVARGILPDGMWFERSLGYHGYTVRALVTLCEADRNSGGKLYELGGIRNMFTLPLRLAQPNLVPPSLNDQGYSRGRIGTRELEWAVAWYGDPAAASALQMLYAEGATRGGLDVLKYGEELPPAEAYVSPGSTDMPGAGLAVLRRGGRDGLCAMLEYGEHGGGHGHPDKLQLILYGLGQTLCPDLGTTGYGVPLHGRWYKTTPGHNTVTVGTRNQKPCTGRLLGFRDEPGAVTVAAEATDAYPGVRMVRRLLLTDSFAVDVFDVQAAEPDTLDWFLRAPGALGLSVDVAPVAEEPANATYAYLTETEGAGTDAVWEATWDLSEAGSEDGGRFVLTMAGEPGTQVLRCRAPGLTGGDPWHTLRVRRQAAATRFAAVYRFAAAGSPLPEVRFREGGVTVGTDFVRFPGPGEELLSCE